MSLASEALRVVKRRIIKREVLGPSKGDDARFVNSLRRSKTAYGGWATSHAEIQRRSFGWRERVCHLLGVSPISAPNHMPDYATNQESARG
jgi:hypothetical protein